MTRSSTDRSPSIGYAGLGRRRSLIPVPPLLWQRQVQKFARSMHRRYFALQPLDRDVRAFVVREMPCLGVPITPEHIATGLGVPVALVRDSLKRLDQGKAWLVLDARGCVSRAFPCTVAGSPHHLTFESGERLDAAGGVDAVAAPPVHVFMCNRPVTATIDSACACCWAPIRFRTDGIGAVSGLEPGCALVVLVPTVDVFRQPAPTIIDDF